MNEKLLREFVRLIIHESPLARVPTQLLEPTEIGKKRSSCTCDAQEERSCSCDGVDEFSAVGGGGVAGYTGGFATDPDKLKRKKG